MAKCCCSMQLRTNAMPSQQLQAVPIATSTSSSLSSSSACRKGLLLLYRSAAMTCFAAPSCCARGLVVVAADRQLGRESICCLGPLQPGALDFQTSAPHLSVYSGQHGAAHFAAFCSCSWLRAALCCANGDVYQALRRQWAQWGLWPTGSSIVSCMCYSVALLPLLRRYSCFFLISVLHALKGCGSCCRVLVNNSSVESTSADTLLLLDAEHCCMDCVSRQ